MKKPIPGAPASKAYFPPAYEVADVVAVQALMRGEADADQQVRAVGYLINQLCAYYDLSFRPGPDGARETDFMEGRRFVGAQMVKLSKLNVSKLRQDPSRGPEPRF